MRDTQPGIESNQKVMKARELKAAVNDVSPIPRDGVKRPPFKKATYTKRPPIQKGHLCQKATHTKRPPIPKGHHTPKKKN